MGANTVTTADNRHARPRTLHVLWSGAIGGMEGAIVPLLRRQRENGASVALFLADPSGPTLKRFEATGATIEAVPLRGAADLRRLFRLVGVLRRYDVHHFHFAEPLLLVASILAGRKVRVYTERGGAYARMSVRKRIRHALTRVLVRRFVRAFSGNTAHAARVVADRYGLDPDQVLVTPNAVALDRLEVRAEPAAVRESWGIPRDAFVVATAGALKPWKRIDMIVRAVASRGSATWWVLVIGDGPDRGRLEALARELGVHAVFTGMQEDVGDLVAAADVFAFPSDALESFGNAAVEAMALGRPTVVLGDSPGVAGHIERETTGFVAADEADLAETLKRLAEDPQLRRRVGAAAAAAVRAAYTVERMAAAYDRLYEAADASRSARAPVLGETRA